MLNTNNLTVIEVLHAELGLLATGSRMLVNITHYVRRFAFGYGGGEYFNRQCAAWKCWCQMTPNRISTSETVITRRVCKKKVLYLTQ